MWRSRVFARASHPSCAPAFLSGLRRSRPIRSGAISELQELRALAARDAHMARNRRAVVPPVDDEIVALGLAGDRVLDGRIEELVAFRAAQGRPEIGRILLAETHVEGAGAGEADAIAALTEI